MLCICLRSVIVAFPGHTHFVKSKTEKVQTVKKKGEMLNQTIKQNVNNILLKKKCKLNISSACEKKKINKKELLPDITCHQWP